MVCGLACAMQFHSLIRGMEQLHGGIMRAKKMLVALTTIVVVIASNAMSQERASIQALATVVSSLSITGTNDLQFGTVTPGVSKAVDKSTVGFAGEWSITGTAAAEISIDFALPTQLQTSDSLGRMDISFRLNDASWSNGVTNQSAPSGVLNPNGPTAQRIGAGGQMFVWVGGVVDPRLWQTGGDYSAEIMLTIAYTGN